MSLIPGLDKFNAMLEAQNVATKQHREWEGETLRAINLRLEQTKAFAEATNGKVNKAAVDIAVLQEAERQAAIIQAAKIKAEEEAKNRKVTWRQGFAFAISGALVAGVLGALALFASHAL